jgi:uncharacterized cupin superfamily protein
MADWFTVNVRDAAWGTHEDFGSACRFETRESPFTELGINIRVLQPGQPNCLYHSESAQEGFLVLAGECLLLVDGVERPLEAWDFVHCPAGTEHVFVGAGDRPCAILMVGVRQPDEKLFYPKSELAGRYGASAEADTPDPDEAYAPYPPPKEGRPEGWDTLPWA